MRLHTAQDVQARSLTSAAPGVLAQARPLATGGRETSQFAVTGGDDPIALCTVVSYRGEPALTVARWKPVGRRWQYDLLTNRDRRLIVITGLSADDFTVGGADAEEHAHANRAANVLPARRAAGN